MMFSNRFSQLLILVGLSLSCLPCTAQDDPKVSLQFLAFPKQLRPEPIELVIGEKKTIKVETPGNELSPAYEVPQLETIIVGETSQNEKGEDVFQVYGRAEAIGASKQIILLFRKGKKNSDGFVVMPINGDLVNFKGGSYVFFNVSKSNVGVVIGDKKMALKPGQRELLSPQPDHENGICQVTLSYQIGDRWKTFMDTRWPVNENYRSLVFFYQNPENGRLGVYPIVDMLPYQAAETE